MRISGHLKELSHQHENPVKYFLQVNDEKIQINQYINRQVKIKFLNEINCVHCGREIKKTYNNGYCYPCFIKLPQNDICIVKPNLCHYDNGTCRDELFGQDYCLLPHYVYLALSSDVKVGITRKTNAFRRWIDQGAVQSIPIAELPTRKKAGDLEIFLSQHLPDKTNWRKMLKGEIAKKDILEVREEIRPLIPEEFQSYLLDEKLINEFIYPITESLDKIKSVTLDKMPEVVGKLLGIKGQYLILDIGVFNIRKHTGYKVDVELVGSD